MVDAKSGPWAIDEAQYPQDAPIDQRLRFLLGYAILAPSSHNTQPWLWRIRNGVVDLYADRTRGLPVADPDDRELALSCGAALFQFRLALRRFGQRCETTVFPEPDDPDLLVRVRPVASVTPSAEDLELFRAIPQRRTNRRAFEPRPIPESVLASLSAAAASEGRVAAGHVGHGTTQCARAADRGRRPAAGRRPRVPARDGRVGAPTAGAQPRR